jgi:hypothetical protein
MWCYKLIGEYELDAGCRMLDAGCWKGKRDCYRVE